MGRYHELGDVELRGDEVFLKATGEKLKVTVEKMAKSKMNGVNPDDVIRDYGADVLRLYEMFMGEFELPKPWDPRAIEGVNRFIKRVWRLVEEWDAAKAPADDPHLRLRHKTIKRVTADLERMQFNTAIAAMMEYLNVLAEGGVNRATRADLDAMLRLAAPFAPAPGRRGLGAPGRQGLHARAGLAGVRRRADHRRDGVNRCSGRRQGARQHRHLTDRVGGRRRAAALALPNVAKHLEGRAIKKFIYKPGRIIGIVTAPA